MFGRKRKPKEIKQGFLYFAAPEFNSNNLGRYTLPRQYTPPKSGFAGSAGVPVLRSMEVFKPAVAMRGYTVTHNDPRGLAGNSPVPNTPGTSPLVNLNNHSFANPTPIG